MSSIVDHPVWPAIRPYVVIQHYGRDVGPRGTRWRIEVCPPSWPTADAWLTLETPCCAECGRSMHPFRQRQDGSWRQIYFAAACPASVSLSCSRGKLAADEYLRVRADVENHAALERWPPDWWELTP